MTLIHRRDALRAERILQQRLFANPKISVVWDNVVEEITGGGSPPTVVPACGCATCRHGGRSRLPVDGVFIAIGHTPTTALFAGQVEMDAEGYIQHRAGQHADLGRGRVRGGRRAGQNFPPGGDSGWDRVHGGAGGGKVSGRDRDAALAAE